MPRGGRRTGTPGKAYPNRSDLQGAGYSSKTYGDGAARAARTAAAPVGPPPAPSVPGASAPTPAVPTGPAPGTLGDLLAPTARPDQPVTAGAPFGPGSNAGSFMPSPDDQAIDRLRVVVRQTGLPSLIRLLEAWDD